ncbi:MAG TPA: DUF177 domain-containing protein [Haliangium sp.]|nr:DUF177 domain-containing protein [Haliangium sp.]
MSSPSTTSPLIVSVRDLPLERRFEPSSELIRDALAGLPMREALERGTDAPAGEATADLSIYTEDENVFVRGPLRGWIEVACSRCLGPARVTLDDDLAVTYLPRARLPQPAANDAADGVDSEPPRGSKRRAVAAAGTAAAEVDEKELGAELTDDDLDLYGYDGEEIDLTPLFRDQVVLAVPFAPLCSEDCKGLCPQCGVDRNLETCDCKPPVDPRWAALQQHLKT